MDFRYLVETKNEFNNFLCGILVTHIFHGIKGMFRYSENVFDQIEQKNKRGSKINNPGIVQIFKKTLDGIKELNNHEIEEEYQRIKIKSGCIDFFDNMVRAVFKSYVLFLTWDPKIEESKYTDNSIYEQISIKDYIHKCYIVSCEYFRENPELFLNMRNNKKDIMEIIKNCIDIAIKKSLPYNQIIEEYMQIEFTKKDNRINKELADVKNMVNDMINNRKYGKKPIGNGILLEESDDFIDVNNKLSRKEEVKNFIKNEIENENVNEKRRNSLLETSENPQELDDSIDIDNDSTSGIPTEPNNLENSMTSRQVNGSNITNSNEQSRSAILSGTTAGTSANESRTLGLGSASMNNTSGIVTRSSMKSKELNGLIQEMSETSDNNMSNKSNKSNKSKSIEEISSPPVLRIKAIDRINEFERDAGAKLDKKKSDRKSDRKSDKKSDIKVIRKKKNNLSNKFEELESYYDTMIK